MVGKGGGGSLRYSGPPLILGGDGPRSVPLLLRRPQAVPRSMSPLVLGRGGGGLRWVGDSEQELHRVSAVSTSAVASFGSTLDRPSQEVSAGSVQICSGLVVPMGS